MISSHPARHALERLLENMARPRALLVISPHWPSRQPCLSSSAWPETLHDFVGFSAALNAIDYPAPGAPALAAEVAERLHRAGYAATTAPRGMDHGVCIPMAASAWRTCVSIRGCGVKGQE